MIGQPSLPDSPARHGNLVLTHFVPHDPANDQELTRAHIPKPSFFLLRPDGHVGLAGTHLEDAVLSHYLAERLGKRGHSGLTQ